jgi:hypothetical protein
VLNAATVQIRMLMVTRNEPRDASVASVSTSDPKAAKTTSS